MIDELRDTLPSRRRVRLERPQRAAVLVGIVDDGAPLRLLMIRRTTEVATHQGQVAFPGGHVESHDADPAATALREAEEEIALPRAGVEVIGLLDDLPTISDTVAVTPVVGRIGRLPDLVPDPREVARIFTIPLADLQRADRWRQETLDHRGRPRRVFFFEHDGETLWGLSARIALELLDRTRAGSPVPLRAGASRRPTEDAP